MDKKEFIKVLDEKGYKWREEGEWIIVEESNDPFKLINLSYLKSIPNNVRFNNEGGVNLGSLELIPDNVQFNNRGGIYLGNLKSIPDNFQFDIGGSINLTSMKLIPINIDVEEMFPKCVDICINGKWLNLEWNITFPNYRWERVDSRSVQMYESWVKNNY